MTIDRGYLEICKKISPGAFSRALPFKPQTAFIDGQLHLMRPSFINTWDMFLKIQYVNPINRLFDMGATTVVLAFDNYKYTPGAKQPTQRKRTTKIPKLNWDQREDLPSIIPANYDQLIMNRVFKARVCQLVVSTIAGLVTLGNGRSLVLDYDDFPIEFTEGDVAPTQREGYVMLGESDVKFCSHLVQDQPFVADSVDGDYVMIAAMQVEKARLEGKEPSKILVRRIEIKSVAQKRLRGGVPADGPPRRQYEFVNVNMMVDALTQHLRNSHGVTNECRGHEVRLFCYLVALVGCDFTAGIPRVGPTTVWKHLGKIWGPLQTAYDPTTGEFDVRKVCNSVIAPLLHTVHRKHAAGVSEKDITRLLCALHESKTVSDKAREALPSVSDIACLARNSNWVMHYWWDATTVPSSAQAKYGFKIKKNGEVERDAQAVLG
jgi:hypothetical protein